MALSGGDGGGGSAGAVRAGAAYVELGTRDAKLVAGLKKGAADVAKWAAGAAVAVVAGLAKSVSTLGDLSRVGEVAQAFNTPVEKLSGLFGVMERSGSGIRESIESISQFQSAITNAVSGKGGEAAELFTILGRSADEFRGMDAAESVFQLFDALQRVNDPAQKFRALAIATGEDGMKTLIPMLNLSNDQLRQQAQMYATSAAEVESARQATLAYAGASAAVNRAWRSVAAALSPAITGIANAVEEAVGWTRQMARVGQEVGAVSAEGWTLTAQSVEAYTRQLVNVGLIEDVARAGVAGVADAFTKGLTAAGLTVNGFADDVLKTFEKVAAGIVLSVNGAFQTVSKSVTGLALLAGRSGFTDIQGRLNTLAGSFSVAGPAAGNAAGAGLDSVRAGFGQFKLGAGLGLDILRAGAGELQKRLAAAMAGQAPPGFGGGAGGAGAPGFVGGASRGGFLGGGPSALATLGGSVPQQQLNELKKLNDKVGALPAAIAAATQLRAT